MFKVGDKVLALYQETVLLEGTIVDVCFEDFMYPYTVDFGGGLIDTPDVIRIYQVIKEETL